MFRGNLVLTWNQLGVMILHALLIAERIFWYRYEEYGRVRLRLFWSKKLVSVYRYLPEIKKNQKLEYPFSNV